MKLHQGILKRAKLFFALAVLFISCKSELYADVMGGKVFGMGEEVTLTINQGDASYLSEIWLFSGPPVFIGDNQNNVGDTMNLGVFDPGVELMFGIVVNDEYSFMMGPGSRNPDDVMHAAVEYMPNNMAFVNFEDIFGGGDGDFNDVMFELTGVSRVEETPEPASMLIWAAVGGTGLFYVRRKNRSKAA